MFICGSGSFGHQDEDDQYNSPCPTPKRSRRSTSFCKIIGRNNNEDKNPYAKRGLDKFYALLAEHDDKKQKIYKEMGSEDISFVRFVYPHDSDRVKPIIVKVKDKKLQEKNNNSSQELIIKTATDQGHAEEASDNKVSSGSNDTKIKKKRSLRIKPSLSIVESLKRPYFYLPLLVVLILLFLAIYGRSFAILCTSIGWYMVPTISSSSSSPISSTANERKLKRKKEYVRKQSEKTMTKVHVHSPGPSSPKSVINGLSELKH